MSPAIIVVAVLASLILLVGLSVALGLVMSGAPLPGLLARLVGSTGGLSPRAPAAAQLREKICLVPQSGKPYFLDPRRLDGQGLTIGRDPGLCDLVFRDQHVSAQHARLWRSPAGLQIQDLGSFNGTWREGERILKSALQYGECIQIGNTSFRLYQHRC